jgi:hypothetical protein
MKRLGWTLATPEPVATSVHNGVRLLEVALRFPADAPAGGEIRVQRLLDDAPVGAPTTVVIEPGHPALDVALAALERAMTTVLTGKGVVPASVEGTVTTVEIPVEKVIVAEGGGFGKL